MSYNIKEASKILGITAYSVYSYINRGILLAYKRPTGKPGKPGWKIDNLHLSGYPNRLIKDLPKFIPAKKLAKILGCSRQRVWQFKSNKVISCVKVGRSWRYSLPEALSRTKNKNIKICKKDVMKALGTENEQIVGQFRKLWRLSFQEALVYARKLGLKSKHEWDKYVMSEKRPEYIPTYPDISYRKEWVGWDTWLGAETLRKIR